MTLIQTKPISGITESVIEAYFESLNSGKFMTTANLFAVDGVLNPPFDSPVVGPEAIATYLQAEAQGMKLEPLKGTRETWENQRTRINITGKVQTPLFSVNVAWTFIIKQTKEIELVEVNLLASLAELAKLRR
ncbi:MAG TPA: nuclear transport factor 2 [Cyanothece sp. UBA12306]|nr:nuclear transport factor 2 [Cyanothece sp. UBA12306]